MTGKESPFINPMTPRKNGGKAGANSICIEKKKSSIAWLLIKNKILHTIKYMLEILIKINIVNY